jgi:hypothetical protein
MRRARNSSCERCGAELVATGRHAERAHAAGLCLDCWLDVPSPTVRPMPPCSRCQHSALYHEYDPLACVYCALSPLAHVHGIGSSTYTLREGPRSGARCNVPGCECFDSGGYCPREDEER